MSANLPPTMQPSSTVTNPNTLVQDSIYAMLFLHGFGDVPGMYHWAIYHHKNEKEGGFKYHIRNLGMGWITDHGKVHGALRQMYLVGMVRIGSTKKSSEQSETDDSTIGKIITEKDSFINEPGVTCKTWALSALHRLASSGYIFSEDIAALDKEIVAFGDKYQRDAVDGIQPRPVQASSICHAQ